VMWAVCRWSRCYTTATWWRLCQGLLTRADMEAVNLLRRDALIKAHSRQQGAEGTPTWRNQVDGRRIYQTLSAAVDRSRRMCMEPTATVHCSGLSHSAGLR
jgi:hypothetical protein